MPKEKPKRQCNYKISSKTLDLRHQTKMDDFVRESNSMSDFLSELNSLQSNFSNISNKNKTDITDDEISEMSLLKDNINTLQNQIQDIRKNTHEIEYFTNTADVLFEYYSLLENSNNSMNSTTPSRKNIPVDSKSSNTKSKSVLDFFFNNNPTNSSNSETPEQTQTEHNGSVNVSINENNRAHLLEKYLSYTDTDYINNNITNIDPNICSYCGTETVHFYAHESIYSCTKCHTIEKIITDNEKPSYKDPPKEISYFSYKRINHYTEWLNQIQGKETTEIPNEVFASIMNELKKQRISDINTVTNSKVKEILKKLKINKYYEHIPYILNRISGNPNPHLSHELEEKLKHMFKEIQVPFLKFSPLNRKNFLSYSYVIHKFIQLLGQNEYLKYFPLLKSREKLHQQEEIWKKICTDLDWQFIRSI